MDIRLSCAVIESHQMCSRSVMRMSTIGKVAKLLEEIKLHLVVAMDNIITLTGPTSSRNLRTNIHRSEYSANLQYRPRNRSRRFQGLKQHAVRIYFFVVGEQHVRSIYAVL